VLNFNGAGKDTAAFAARSLVSLHEFELATVSPTRKRSKNIIFWMDHRTISQADIINRTGHEVLK
jgi:ribulose kinase